MPAKPPATAPSDSRQRARVVLHLPSVGSASTQTPARFEKVDEERTAHASTRAANTTTIEETGAPSTHQVSSFPAPDEIEPLLPASDAPAAPAPFDAMQASPLKIATGNARPATGVKLARGNSLTGLLAFIKKPPVALAALVVLFLNLAAVIWWTRPERIDRSLDTPLAANDATPAEGLARQIAPLDTPLIDEGDDGLPEEVSGTKAGARMADLRARHLPAGAENARSEPARVRENNSSPRDGLERAAQGDRRRPGNAKVSASRENVAPRANVTGLKQDDSSSRR